MTISVHNLARKCFIMAENNERRRSSRRISQHNENSEVSDENLDAIFEALELEESLQHEFDDEVRLSRRLNRSMTDKGHVRISNNYWLILSILLALQNLPLYENTSVF